MFPEIGQLLVSVKMIPSPSRPYVDEVTLRLQNLSRKISISYELEVYFWRGLDLFVEVLLVSVGQKATKLQAVKNGGLKKNSAT